MLAEERQNLILEMVNSRGSVSITEIQRKLKVSRETVRRDLMLLAGRNRLRKTHGGALSLERSEPEIAVRQVTNAEGKRAIGRVAASLVPDGASVILASGTTVQSVADALLIREGLTVFTNSIVTCAKLAGHNEQSRLHAGRRGAVLQRRHAGPRRDDDADALFRRLRLRRRRRDLAAGLADGLHARGGRAAQPHAAVGAHAGRRRRSQQVQSLRAGSRRQFRARSRISSPTGSPMPRSQAMLAAPCRSSCSSPRTPAHETARRAPARSRAAPVPSDWRRR